MQAVGVVAEYNPFHKGHQYHIAETRKQLPDADGVIVVMSGNFTQRGEPALFDKWTRAHAALLGGADLVVELPTAFATRSAGYFARGAVLTLAATGVVSHLSCGAESDPAQNTQQLLQQTASFLAKEPTAYKQALQTFLNNGVSFPTARLQALQACGVAGADLLTGPNNILALEYMQTIAQESLTLTPLLIARAGQYHADTVPTDSQQFASATAIRNLILHHDDSWQHHIPETSAQVLLNHMQDGYPPMQADAFNQILLFLLRRTTPEQLREIIEISEGLEHRIYDAAHDDSVHTIADLCCVIKSKRFTYTRMQRTLLHILLNFTHAYEAKEPAYVRVLGFNSTGQKLLKEMKKTAQLPVLIRPAKQRNTLSELGHTLFALDQRATNLYYTGYTNTALHKNNLDYIRLPVQIP